MSDRRYRDTHEWHTLEGSIVTLGISRFAVDELTDVTFVELPAVGDAVEAGEPIGEIESVKATSDLYTGVSGTVTEVNDQAVDDPSIINEDPFGAGWLVRIEASRPEQFDALMEESAYNEKYPAAE
jgi:glycine cleavage system H protein